VPAAIAGAALLAAAGWWFGGGGAAPAPIAVATEIVPTGAAAAAGSSVLDASGSVIARRQATVSAKVTGKVVEVLIEEGMAVREGQVLARLDDSIPRGELALAASRLAAAKASLHEFDTQLRQARLDERRAAELASRKLASQAEADRTRLAREGMEARIASARAEIAVSESALAVQRSLLDDLTIRAPFSGVVVAKAAQPGEMISPISAGGGFTRTGIGTVVDMESLEVEVDVNESYINRVQPAQPVEVVLNAYPDLRLAGRVIAIIPTADRNKATVRVRIGFVTRDPRILPDMGVKVSFLPNPQPGGNAKAAPPKPSVSSSALRGEGGARYVLLVPDDATLVRRDVRAGRSVGDRVEIEDGVTGGERVLVGARDGSDVAFEPGMKVQP
jgi:RND family efflux transporter MFP subunit